MPEDFVYSSDRAEPRLDLAATRAMIERVADGAGEPIQTDRLGVERVA